MDGLYLLRLVLGLLSVGVGQLHLLREPVGDVQVPVV